MKIIHHNDNDGRLAAYIVEHEYFRAYPNPSEELEYIEMRYNTPVPFDKIEGNETVYIVDYSLSPEDMEKLMQITTNVVWIDHHKTAIEKYKDFPAEIPGIRYDGISGCMLTWCYMQYTIYESDLITGARDLSKYFSEARELWDKYLWSAPVFIKYVNDYDVWNFDRFGETEIKAFERGCFFHDPRPCVEGNVWRLLFSDKNGYDKDSWCSKVLKDGKTILKYDAMDNRSVCKNGFDATICGYKAFVINTTKAGSDVFKSIIEDKNRVNDYDLFVTYYFDGKNYRYSLRSGFSERSDEVDVSEIAEYHGGGGHKHAAGCSSKELIFYTV